MIIGLLRNNEKQIDVLKKSIHDMEEKLSHDIEILKRYQTEILEMKNSKCQIKKTVESLNNSLGDAEQRISELEDKSLEISQIKRIN